MKEWSGRCDAYLMETKVFQNKGSSSAFCTSKDFYLHFDLKTLQGRRATTRSVSLKKKKKKVEPNSWVLFWFSFKAAGEPSSDRGLCDDSCCPAAVDVAFPTHETTYFQSTAWKLAESCVGEGFFLEGEQGACDVVCFVLFFVCWFVWFLTCVFFSLKTTQEREEKENIWLLNSNLKWN